MRLVSYERDGQYLVIFPELPQWAVVTELGVRILRLHVDGSVPRHTMPAHFPDYAPEFITREFDALVELYRDGQGGQPEISAMLTPRPTIAMIAVTRLCNLRCPHCYVDARCRLGPELTVEEHRHIARQLILTLARDPEAQYRINLTGGEPFVHHEVLSIIEAYRDVGLDVTMSTNAELIRDDQIERLAELNVTLSVSLDGARAATHDAIRGAGQFERVVARMRRMVDRGVRVGINHLVHTGNFHELGETIDLANRLGCSGFNPINLVQLGRACDSSLARVEETKLFRRLTDQLLMHPEQLPLFERTSLYSSLGAALLAGITCASCGVGTRPCVYISPEGDVYPCANTQRPEFSLGNLRQDPLSSVLREDHPVLTVLRGLEVNNLNPSCARCDVRRFCGGDCRGETYNVTGNLRAPYVACQDRHDSLVELMWTVAKHSHLFAKRASEFLDSAASQGADVRSLV